MKKRNIIISIIIIILLITISYVTFFHKFVDERLYNEAKVEIDSFIENPWTGSIKEGVSKDDLITVEKKMKFILSKDKKKSLKKETDTILKQANLQTRLKEESEKNYKADDPFNISEESIQKLIQDSSKIKNNKVRVKILQESYEVLDRLQSTKDATKQVGELYDNLDHLKIENLKDYYTAQGLVENVYYKSSKSTLSLRLEPVKKKLDDLMRDADKMEEAQLKKDLDNIKNTKYEWNKSSTDIKNISTEEFKDYKFFSDNSSIEYIGYIINDKIIFYNRDNNGFRKEFKSFKITNNLNKNTTDYLKRESSSFLKEEFESKQIDEPTTDSSINKNEDSSVSDSSGETIITPITEEVSINKLLFDTPEHFSITEQKDEQNSITVSESDYNEIKELLNNGLIIKM